ncbi:endosialidase [Hominifimenecus sp. rT4P-3]|uniref:endosialidase n=1 Tax=Hominifimenecus sp. rT4P-3 TaxID=3242979 RepID=UPI003DA684EA
MSVVTELLQSENDGTISFGDYTREQKGKREDFEHGGDVYKVKTYDEITKLERNGLFVYESVPGSTVTHFLEKENGVSFQLESSQDVQITLELAESTEYEIFVDGEQVGLVETNRSGKLSFSVELEKGAPVQVKVVER